VREKVYRREDLFSQMRQMIKHHRNRISDSLSASQLLAVVFGPTILRLINDDAREQGQKRFHLTPNPDRDIFGGWVFETRNIVEAMVIHRVEPRMKRGFYIEEIGDESRDLINRTVELQLDPLGMAVHPVTAMCLRHVWKLVRRFEAEGLNDFHCAIFMGCRGTYASGG
jgi:hypothetical protein